jgi:hypothetical protein
LNKPGRRFVLGQSSRVAYPNVFLDGEGRIVLKRKNAGNILQPKSLVAACGRDIPAHQKMECRTCHTAWAPQCISCHTSFDPKAEGWDHLAGRLVLGSWQEKSSDFRAEPPTLGVEQVTAADGTKLVRIGTFVPGMVMTLNQANAATLTQPDGFHRLFAPTSAHTTVTQARDCRSCHADPVALGYGRGKLAYVVSGGHGEWTFAPALSQSPQDGLPADAWVGFLQEPNTTAATRTNVRPFTLAEQRRILLVGACLQCHGEKEPRMIATFADFAHFKSRIGPQCRLPIWAEDVIAPSR